MMDQKNSENVLATVQSGGQVSAAPAPPKAAKACDEMQNRRGTSLSTAAASRLSSPPTATYEPAPVGWTAPSTLTAQSFQGVLNRLDAIESFLALNAKPSPAATVATADEDERGDPKDLSLLGLWAALDQLRESPRHVPNSRIWKQNTVKQLWLDFHKNMPGLHFLPTKQTFSAPTPLLLASMLYVSSLRHSEPELAALSSDYFIIMCGAIAELTIPPPELDHTARASSPSTTEENAFQDVLGLILAGLTCEASTKTTGIWISIGYRLVLESCPKEVDERSREWQRLFSGLQILDLEHASLHMSCPIIPLHAPLSRLHVSSEDDIYSLSQMMHTGLTHFTGRGLPTIWSCFSTATETTFLSSPFTPVDAAVIRDWATQLDRWLARFNTQRRFASEHGRMLIFRQYILHRLLVLSIYHPARGFNLFSTSTTSVERRELLVSARAALKLQMDDRSIWANWDFVMITWAALLVLQGIEGGVGEDDDLPMVQDLLNTLRTTQEPATGLRNQLANKLEATFQSLHTPPPISPAIMPIPMSDGLSWSIFDEMSLQFAYPDQWPI
ncbi:hypothetical protein BP6252_04420 [Coleophoma cylindrospora]|uniref:Transcription factor domain-containing protein n=1 Tax=Coleophoma cylindrospora TaxID=1849047 RepID=A0A3D8S0F1_9HELO|nr:hypothetical protein BP6252_04420 [Coleophoma cylindrospora]